MTTTKVFYNNRTQAIRLPKAVAFGSSVREVEVRIVGNARMVIPADLSWDDWFDKGSRVDPDFLADRDQPPLQERQPL
ncbi:MAG: antitoxin [Bifidobacteriaceae bacterium]|jgi:antitoxin VapB|nr:antitoxin [Bifidobacteriaceae bacterium]